MSSYSSPAGVRTVRKAAPQDRLVICLFLAFVVLALARCWNNLPWCDEGWFFDTVYNLLTKGHTGTTVLVAKGFPWDGIERYQYWQPPMFWIVDSVWLKVFGLTLPALRSLSVVAGVGVLFCWFSLLRWSGAPRPVQILAIAIIATDYAVVKAGSDGRMDMLAAFFGLAGVTVYLRLRESRFGWAIFLSQTLIVCGGLTHPMGGMPYIAMFAYFFLTGRDWKRLRPSYLLLAACPYVIGAAGWISYILNDPAHFRSIFFGSNVHGRMDSIFNPLLALKNELVSRYLEPFGLRSSFWVLKSKLLIPVVYLTSMIAVWLTRPLRREPFLRPFLAMWTIAALSLIFLDAQRNGTYMIHVFPLYGILLASLVWWLWNHIAPRLRFVVAAGLAGFILLQVSGSVYLIVKSPLRNQYLPVVEYVKQHTTRGQRVVGSAELGFGLGFDNVYDDEGLGYYVNLKPDMIVLAPRYREYYAMARTQKPQFYQFVMNRLDAYQVVFRTDAYEVYVPRER